jgi:hypothetical protein
MAKAFNVKSAEIARFESLKSSTLVYKAIQYINKKIMLGKTPGLTCGQATISYHSLYLMEASTVDIYAYIANYRLRLVHIPY